MDVSTDQGGEGWISPTQLLPVALMDCTGTNVVGIFRKQRQKVNALEIFVSGDRVAGFPRVYRKVHVGYRSRGDSLKERAVKRAIQLSEDKYCSVGAMMKSARAAKL